MTSSTTTTRDHDESHERNRLIDTWTRRLITLPLYFALLFVTLLLLPILLFISIAVDLMRKRRGALTRALLFVTSYLFLEVTGILLAAATWIFSGAIFGLSSDRYTRWNFALERWWARRLMAAAQRTFGLELRLHEDVPEIRGPIIVFVRHVSIGDTLLPSIFIGDRFGIDLRYVLKRELLWDPCLDIVGNRLPNYFARRGSTDHQREIAAVQSLLDNVGPSDGVLIYPEGTRFTEEKRHTILQKLRDSQGAELYDRAVKLTRVLPPRLGGPLGLLEHNRSADVVFLAHVGFEGSMNFTELFNGCLVDRTIHIGLWRVPFDEIPKTREGRVDWLFEQWSRMDSWIARHQGVPS